MELARSGWLRGVHPGLAITSKIVIILFVVIGVALTDVTDAKIRTALADSYPDGHGNVATATLLMTVFRRHWAPDYLQNPVTLMVVVAVFTLEVATDIDQAMQRLRRIVGPLLHQLLLIGRCQMVTARRPHG